MGPPREAAPDAGRNLRKRKIHETYRPRSGQLRIEFVTGDSLMPRRRDRNRGGGFRRQVFAIAQPEAAKIVRPDGYAATVRTQTRCIDAVGSPQGKNVANQAKPAPHFFVAVLNQRKSKQL